jgi:hypothetical protein
MAPFFRWHGHEGHWLPHEGRRHWERWHRREEPGPGPSPGPDLLQSVASAATAPITAPLKAIGGLFGLEVEDPFPPPDEDAEMHRNRYRRPSWARYHGDENSESIDELAPAKEQTETWRRTGRWVRHRGATILLGVYTNPHNE